MSELRPVFLVGHCGPDAHMLRSAVRRAAPHAEVSLINEEHRLLNALTDQPLLLINRVLDGDFTSDSGIGLIQMLQRQPNPPTMMLVSNFPDAQEHAMAAGAIQGFGKSHVYADSTLQILHRAIASS